MPLIEIEQLNIEIFGGCNYSCEMCPQSESVENGGRDKDFKKILPFDIFDKIVTDAMHYGVKAVSLHGSGEPTVHPQLIGMVTYLSKRGLEPSFFTNGYKLTGKLFTQLLEAGIKLITVSAVGATEAAYTKWMEKKNGFKVVRKNLLECVEILKHTPNTGILRTRHLITVNATDRDAVAVEIDEYRKYWTDFLNCQSEIWMMHNWAGQYDSPYERLSLVNDHHLRSCGRPFAKTLEVRAGGIGKHFGAVVPCPFVLGNRDRIAVLGHLDTQTIAEIYAAEPLNILRKAHEEERFNDIDYCKGCDMLVATKGEALAWSNVPGRHEGQSATSDVDYLVASSQVRNQFVPLTISAI